MDKVNQEYGHQCVTHMYLYVQWYTARVDVMQLHVARDTERLLLFCFAYISLLFERYIVLQIMCASKVNYYY